MIKFLIKKSFFDAWDNLLGLIIINLGFIIFLAITILLPAMSENFSGPVIFLLTIPGIVLLHLYAGTISIILHNISDFKPLSFTIIKKGFLQTWKASLVLAVINDLIAITLTIGIPFYLSMGNVLGIAGAGIIFWLSFLGILSCQFFFPVFFKLKGGVLQCLKKSILLTLDNPLFSIFILFHSIVLLILSAITVLFMPGISSILLLHQDAVKLRLYKYDWLEQNSDANRKKIPWDILIKDDKEKVGKRSLKAMIFPWKD